MDGMQTLRHARFLARLVLAWFALALGAAVAAPFVKPQALELVCSAGSTVKLVQTGDEGGAATGHVLDCPLCLVGGAPPPAPHVAPVHAQPLAHVLRPLPPAAHCAVRTAAPLPPRGPPVLA